MSFHCNIANECGDPFASLCPAFSRSFYSRIVFKNWSRFSSLRPPIVTKIQSVDTYDADSRWGLSSGAAAANLYVYEWNKVANIMWITFVSHDVRAEHGKVLCDRYLRFCKLASSNHSIPISRQKRCQQKFHCRCKELRCILLSSVVKQVDYRDTRS